MGHNLAVTLLGGGTCDAAATRRSCSSSSAFKALAASRVHFGERKKINTVR